MVAGLHLRVSTANCDMDFIFSGSEQICKRKKKEKGGNCLLITQVHGVNRGHEVQLQQL